MFICTASKPFLGGLALAAILLGPVQESHALLTAAREAGEKARLVHQGVVKAQRPIMAGLTAGGSSLAPYIGTGLCFGCGGDETMPYTDELTGEYLFGDTTGGALFNSHNQGSLYGTIKMQGIGMLPDSYSIEMDVHFNATFKVLSAGSITLDFQFAGVTNSSSPFMAAVDDVTDPMNPIPLMDIPVLPIEGLSSRQVFLPQAGTYRMAIDLVIPPYTLPAGDSLVGIESYDISWNVVPEPGTGLLAMLGLAMAAARRRHGRA